ncbi:DUF541 domain-containing protein [Balamuthia mandrillaris]
MLTKTILFAVLLATCCMLSIHAQDDNNNNNGNATNVLRVTGEGTATAEANVTEIVLGVEVRSEESASDAIQQAAEQASNLTSFLQEQDGVENLQTVQISLQPIIPPQQQPPMPLPQQGEGEAQETQPLIRGYVATNLISFRVTDIESVGEIIDGAIEAGANRIDSVSVTASDEALDLAREQALQDAVENARAQADIVFEALELEPQGVTSVEINNVFFPFPTPLFSAGAAEAGDVFITPVLGGEQEVTANVVLEFAY